MTYSRTVALLAAAGFALVVTQTATRSTPHTVHTPTPKPGTTATVSPYQFYGMALQVDSSYQAVRRYGEAIREISSLGASSILLSVNIYQENAGSCELFVDPEKTPSDAEWRDIFAIAREENLHIVFMPKILLTHPRGREWRGVIDPGHRWEEWFSAYGHHILHYAKLAKESDITVYIVGSELVSSERFTEQWKKLIAEVRSVLPGTLLCYSSNWDHYESIRFWDDLDLAALTSYYQLAKTSSPSQEELEKKWREYRQKLLQWQSTINKPLLFTEVGWCSQEGCSVEPWNYYRNPQATALGHEEQRRNYNAFIQTWEHCACVAGTLWWEWTLGTGGENDHGYTPKNKPAEDSLRRWFDQLNQNSDRKYVECAHLN